MRILLVGGGSGGPVAPLLAVAAQIKKEHGHAKFLLVGTKTGPEQLMVKGHSISFVAIPAGKLRRYWSWSNLAAPFLVLMGFVRAWFILREFRPDCIFGAGSFVQVPVVYAGWLLGIPSVIHQQDVYPSLANILCQLVVKKISVTFEQSRRHFYSSWLFSDKEEKVVWTGNPFRQELKAWTRKEALHKLKLRDDWPTLLVVGGGSGAEFLNNLIRKALPSLTKSVQVIHLTGRQRGDVKAEPNYLPIEFASDMGPFYAAADLVLCRAGLSTITELANLGKIAILVPMPKTHQEYNSYVVGIRKASLVLQQENLSESMLLHLVKRLLFDPGLQTQLKENIRQLMPKNADKKVAQLIIQSAEKL